MSRSRRAIHVAGVVLLLAQAACNDAQPPQGVGENRRGVVIRGYQPPKADVRATVGDTIRFTVSAETMSGEPPAYYFVVDNYLVSRKSYWDFVITNEGTVTVRVLVRDGDEEASVAWTVERDTNHPPVIRSAVPVTATPTTTTGEYLQFQIEAFDPEGNEIAYEFRVDGHLVATKKSYVFNSPTPGQFVVLARASDGYRIVNHKWTLTVEVPLDVTPPALVALTSAKPGANAGDLNVEWIAVGDDGMQGTPLRYEVRSASAPILTASDWQQATERARVEPTAPPGLPESFTFRGDTPGQLLWVAVRAVDEAGNTSPISAPIVGTTRRSDLTLTGIVRDALTAAPVPGITVDVSGDLGGTSVTTGADGRFSMNAFPDDYARFRLSDENVSGSVGDYFNIVTDDLYIGNGGDFDFWLIPNLPLITVQYPDFIGWFRHMTDTYTHPLGNKLRTWDTPVEVYVPEISKHGLDYDEIIRSRFAMWETVIGKSLFTFVDAPPAVGLTVAIHADDKRELYSVTEWDADDMPVKATIFLRTIYDASTREQLDTVIAHEIGHALGMAHSSDPIHLMIGNQFARVSEPSQDEILLGRVMYGLPRGLNMVWYRPD